MLLIDLHDIEHHLFNEIVRSFLIIIFRQKRKDGTRIDNDKVISVYVLSNLT